jgi:hypothetical protein
MYDSICNRYVMDTLGKEIDTMLHEEDVLYRICGDSMRWMWGCSALRGEAVQLLNRRTQRKHLLVLLHRAARRPKHVVVVEPERAQHVSRLLRVVREPVAAAAHVLVERDEDRRVERVEHRRCRLYRALCRVRVRVGRCARVDAREVVHLARMARGERGECARERRGERAVQERADDGVVRDRGACARVVLEEELDVVRHQRDLRELGLRGLEERARCGGHVGCGRGGYDRRPTGGCQRSRPAAGGRKVAYEKLMMEEPPASEPLVVETPPGAMRVATWRSRSA